MYCHDQVVDDAVTCPACQAHLHPECAVGGKCPTLGCGAPLASPRPLVRPGRGRLAALASSARARVLGGLARAQAWTPVTKVSLVAGTTLAVALVVVGANALDRAHEHALEISHIVHVEDARTAVANGAPDVALAHLEKAFARGESVELLTLRARAHELAGDRAAAIEDLGRALALAPGDASILAQRGWLRLADDYEKGAEEDARASLAIKPTAGARALLARLELDSGHLAGAASDASAAIQLDEKDPRAWHVYARALEGQGQLAFALKAYDTAERLDPRIPNLHLERGRARLRAGNGTGAIVDASAALSATRRPASAFLLRAQAHESLHHHAEAIEDATRALEQDPLSAEAYEVRGTAYLGLTPRNEAAARESLDRAIDLDPTRAHSYFARGMAEYYLGRAGAAVGDLEKFLDQDPDSPDAPLARTVLDSIRK